MIGTARPKSWWQRAALGSYARAGWYFARPMLRDQALAAIKGGLQKQGLL